MTASNVTLKDIEQYTDEERFKYLRNESTITNKLWILTDEYGCIPKRPQDAGFSWN